METLLLRILPALACMAGTLLSCRKLVHFLQLESYQLPGFFRTLKRDWFTAVTPGVVLAAAGFTVTTLSVVWNLPWLALLQVLLVAGLGVCFVFAEKKEKAKKPLVFTARIKRLFTAMGLMMAVVTILVVCIPEIRLCRALIALLPVILPLWVVLAALLVWPIEKLISWLYLREARQMLAERPDLIKIGITGSYGKTSVKFILGTILREKYPTLVPPSSFNTPMGLTRVIRGKLSPSHRVFLAEMGARHVGDIKELCNLVHPTYGVLTSVGPQHLDTFKDIEHIKSTKYELMDAIPQEGVCFFPDDGAICRELYEKTGKAKRLCCLHYEPEADVWAESISVSSEGCSFRLCTRKGSVDCVTPLLGSHNIQNILLAAMVAIELGLDLKQISRGIARLQPVEHRLQLINNPGGVTVIDDSFNSNPVSSRRALEVLRQFPGRRIVITPGMVELGHEEIEFNRQLGVSIAGSADVAILVGKKHTRPIMDGAIEAGFPMDQCHQVDSLEEAAALLRSIGQSGDTVLFENDLPDHYSE